MIFHYITIYFLISMLKYKEFRTSYIRTSPANINNKFIKMGKKKIAKKFAAVKRIISSQDDRMYHSH